MAILAIVHKTENQLNMALLVRLRVNVAQTKPIDINWGKQIWQDILLNGHSIELEDQ